MKWAEQQKNMGQYLSSQIYTKWKYQKGREERWDKKIFEAMIVEISTNFMKTLICTPKKLNDLKVG